ncbi:DUF5990 family protein [Scleromatobacter humisilvae]|uniref:DUF5990 family protein n=1 Tax=Scleromatobacter humisilvae TaxID=2897159 RepID=A0A9X1YP51_9BURK|nr:DUF5990 family protein [Scleromatobacter humisilvae]MCK9688423.1 DUF5990 family protein [Scleromatobacter humisilvae]
MHAITLQLIYDGKGPALWTPAPGAFGLQDKAGALHVGKAAAAGAVVFDFTLQVKSLDSEIAVLTGDFAHGSPAERFLYLGWANTAGGFAQRLKLPLFNITSAQVREALAKGTPLMATLVDHHPKATSTGANIGGARAVDWTLA